MKLILILLILLILIILILNNTFIKLNFSDKDVELYVINLEGPLGEERRNHIKNIMGKANINYILYPAHNKDNINVSRYKKFKHRELSKGEIALSMTHNDLYKKLLNSRKDFMIIAEDDCTVRPNFKYYLNKVLNNLPNDFDVIKLEYIKKFNEDGNYNNKDNTDVPYDNSTELSFNTYLYPGAACYIISRKGAEYFLSLNEPIWLPADGVFDKKWQNEKNMERNANTYYVTPQLAWQGDLKRVII